VGRCVQCEVLRKNSSFVDGRQFIGRSNIGISAFSILFIIIFLHFLSATYEYNIIIGVNR
jgi:hypothetical protein